MTYRDYAAAWANIPDVQRLRHLRKSVSKMVVFSTPDRVYRGQTALTDLIERFQQTSRGACYELIKMFCWEDRALATWEYVDATGERRHKGYDLVVFDDEGLISDILLFVASESHVRGWAVRCARRSRLAERSSLRRRW